SVCVTGVASVKPLKGLMKEPTSDASMRTAATVTPPSGVGAPAASWIGSTTLPDMTVAPGIGCRMPSDSTQRLESIQVTGACLAPGDGIGAGGVVSLTWQESMMRKPAGTAVTRSVYGVPRLSPPIRK